MHIPKFLANCKHIEMKVVQINAVYKLSSTGRTVMEMHQYFKEHDIDSYKFYSVVNPDSDAFDIVGNTFDHKIHALCSRIFGMQTWFSTSATKDLLKKLDTIRPDVVILRNFHANYINLPLLTKYLAKNDIATIIVLHDCWFFTGHCCHYTEVGCQKWQTECHDCPIIKKNRESWFFDTSRKMFRAKKKLFSAIPRLAVVGVSDWITNEARKSPIFHNAKIFQRIYNWINLKPFNPKDTKELRRKLKLKSEDFVALGVSMAWDYRKGMEIYFEVAKRMPDIKIVMIGKLPEKVDAPSNIINVPPTGSVDELADYYSMADVLFNFSIQETFGKVAAEALACGTPLIVNEVTANPEIPGDCGFVIRNNDVNSIINAINTIHSKGKDYYQQACVDRANSLFEKDTNIEQYIELFNRMTY